MLIQLSKGCTGIVGSDISHCLKQMQKQFRGTQCTMLWSKGCMNIEKKENWKGYFLLS